MRTLTAILLAALLSSQAFYNLGLALYWLANRPYIAATWCKNLDKPELLCSGKCFLQDRLSAAAAHDPAPGNTHPAPDTAKKFACLAEYTAPHPLPEVPHAAIQPYAKPCWPRHRVSGQFFLSAVFQPPDETA